MILFISDLHLQEKRPDITRAFLHFLQTRAIEAQALYILGDFFEAWIGDDGMYAFQHGIAQALNRLHQHGVPIYLMHGNRDFLIGQDFCREAGCELLPDPCVVDLDGERVLLSHGDRLCTGDRDYMRLRRWLRNPLSIALLRRLPLSWRQHIARRLRQSSRERTGLKAADIIDVTPSEVSRIMRHYDVRTLIHGHTHRPNTHCFQLDGQSAQRIVLGDWDRFGWVLEVENRSYRQYSFPL